MFAPNQSGQRFGNAYSYNAFGMRRTELPSDGLEIVLVMGDSVVNGGASTDQNKLATALASRVGGNTW